MEITTQNQQMVLISKGFDPATGKLNGKELIVEKTENTSIERKCSSCFYRGLHHPGRGDCRSRSAKNYFGYERTEIMPVKIDGKEVAYFCPNFKVR